MDVGVWFHICCRYLYLLIPQFLLVVVNIVLKCVYSFLIIYQHILCTGPQADLNIQKSFCRHHFAFNILSLAHRNLNICLPNVYQVVLQKYMKQLWNCSHSDVEMCFSHSTEFESHLPNGVKTSVIDFTFDVALATGLLKSQRINEYLINQELIICGLHTGVTQK